MTTLAATPVDPDQLDMLELIADPWTPVTGKPFAERFRAACLEVARRHGGRVDPNHVRRLLGDCDPRQYSASWAGACGKDGFLDNTDERVDIDASGSKGNGNKQVRVRRWRVTTTHPQDGAA